MLFVVVFGDKEVDVELARAAFISHRSQRAKDRPILECC